MRDAKGEVFVIGRNLEFVEPPLARQKDEVFVDGISECRLLAEQLVCGVGLARRCGFGDGESQCACELLEARSLGHHERHHGLPIGPTTDANLARHRDRDTDGQLWIRIQ